MLLSLLESKRDMPSPNYYDIFVSLWFWEDHLLINFLKSSNKHSLNSYHGPGIVREARNESHSLLLRWLEFIDGKAFWPWHLVFRVGIAQEYMWGLLPIGWAKWRRRVGCLATSLDVWVLRKPRRSSQEPQVVGSVDCYWSNLMWLLPVGEPYQGDTDSNIFSFLQWRIFRETPLSWLMTFSKTSLILITSLKGRAALIGKHLHYGLCLTRWEWRTHLL